jgi:hypothetical protein
LRHTAFVLRHAKCPDWEQPLLEMKSWMATGLEAAAQAVGRSVGALLGTSAGEDSEEDLLRREYQRSHSLPARDDL